MNTSRHIFVVLIVSILTVLFSCDKNTDYEYKKFGIKLSLPDRWFVMSIDSTNDGVHSINCSAKGDDITKVTIDIENLQLDTTSFGNKVTKYKENMAPFSPSFTEVQTSAFNGAPSFKFSYTTSTQFISPISTKGFIESFQLKNKTITVLVMQNVDDTHSDKTGLDRLLKSIKLDKTD